MNILLFLVILHTVKGEFGTSYLKDRRLMDVGKESDYYVVELMDPPSEMKVDQYVCVPNSWLVLRDSKEMVDVAAVKYPIEDAPVTKQRVMDGEGYSDDWMIFVANVKYATDTYEDAMQYIKILNKIAIQERTLEMDDIEMSQALTANANPNSTEKDSELATFPNSDVEACKNQTNVVETVHNTNKRYFTRQTRKMYTTDKLSEAVSEMTLDSSLTEIPVESNNRIDEGTGAKNVKNNDIIENDNQEAHNALLRDEMINEQLADCFKTIHSLPSITGLAMEEHNVLKRLENITMSIKKSIDDSATKDSSKIELPVFGPDFVDLMQNLYCKFDRCQAILFDSHRQYMENCLTTKKIIELVNTLNTLSTDSDDAAEKKDANVLVDGNADEDVEIVSDTESETEIQPQEAQIQSIINTVVQKSFDTTVENVKTDDQKGNDISFKPTKFTLPPEYDPEDSKWTLRYRKLNKDLVEVIPNSGVYVNAIKLAYCKRVARDSKTLARMLMLEIFSDNALATCSLTGKQANAFYSRGDGNVRPGLDQHARMVLMNFVDEYSKENNWPPISTQAIVDSMRNKLQELRVKSSQRKSKNCHAWSCLNTRLGLTDTLPPQEQYSQVLKTLLPETWHDAVDSALNVCYCSSCGKTRSYNNACPGQALLECTVDQLIHFCPDHSWKRTDACSPVTSLAGFKYMFTQGVYENIEANLPYDQRPTWFMRHYFRSKCCNFPELFNSTLMGECGFTLFMHYHRFNNPVRVTESPYYETASQLPPAIDGLNIIPLPSVTPRVYDPEDPLDCCDMSDLIRPSWRSECDFRLNWNVQERLTIEKPMITTTIVPIMTTTGMTRIDIKFLPRPCAETTCVFRKLNIISETGAVDIDAFKQLLHNLTNVEPEWTKAKARVFTKCLTRIPIDYYEDCEINKVLACTFDVLSENCPTAPKNDPCKHPNSNSITNTTGPFVCQISSAKFVPKNRHQPCDLPALVGNDVRDECLISTIDRLETIYVPNRPYVPKEPVSMCKKLTDSTTCLLNKMGVLNKYQFMDYFKMKDKIRYFTSTHNEWQALNDAYLSAFTTQPMYGEYCSSPKKLLNLIDTMLMTCPLSKRGSSPKCFKMFNEISNSPMQNPNATEVQLDQIFHQFQSIFLPKPTHQSQNVLRQKVSHKRYDFGILDDGNAPPVRIIDINPKARPIKVLLPVYQQVYGNQGGDMTINMHHDPMLRGGLGAGLANP